MAWHNETKIIGEKVTVKNEKETGVVTRIDFERQLVFVLFKRLREESYPYPEAFDQNYLSIKYAKR